MIRITSGVWMWKYTGKGGVGLIGKLNATYSNLFKWFIFSNLLLNQFFDISLKGLNLPYNSFEPLSPPAMMLGGWDPFDNFDNVLNTLKWPKWQKDNAEMVKNTSQKTSLALFLCIVLATYSHFSMK